MGSGGLTETTLDDTSPLCDASFEQRTQILALTILHHPDPRRIGDVARLPRLIGRNAAALSRLEPLFHSPGSDPGTPLADPFLSRTAIRLEAVGDSVCLTVPALLQVEVDGDKVEGERTFNPEHVANGVVLMMSRRVVLLLHRIAERSGGTARMGLVGDSDAIQQLRAEIARIADLDVPVLLRGETGTGKDLVARAIHENGVRGKGPCICVSMAAIPPSTAASELFGHVQGAFTGASREHLGHIARADGGTLFLDEIAEMPAELQAMLLRVLETREVQPLGSSRSRKIDVRLIAATDADLEAAIRDGRFREPLFHRLAGYNVFVPPLRSRRDDIGRLVRHFLDQISATSRKANAETWSIPARVVACMARHPWPGNVRQLRNIVRQLVISTSGCGSAKVEAAAAALLAYEPLKARRSVDRENAHPRRTPPRELTEDELIGALRRNKWQTSRAAEELGMSRTSLYARIDRSTRIRKAREIPRVELIRCLKECGGDLDAVSCRLEVSKRGLQLKMREDGLL